MRLQNITIEDCKEIARQRKGECLSTEYVNAHTKLKWKCECGYEWEAKPNHIKRGSWCPVCGGSMKKTIEEMREIAKSRNGECLSTEYVNSQTHLKWRCEHGHEWEAKPSNIKSGKWCPKCAGVIKYTIEEMQDLAKSRNGECLSTEYVNARTKLKWKCECGYEWEATPSCMKSRDSWCPKCAAKKRGENQRLGIEEMQNLAKSRNGECLSTEYINTDTKLKWKCSKGHKWKAIPNSIKRGGWCPHCTASIGERICREYFEKIFDCEFSKSYPKWLVSDEGNQLELDGYCESKSIAFEHHGRQHYSVNSKFYKQDLEFDHRLKLDAEKKNLCLNNGIKLIEIPEIPHLLSIQEVFLFLKNEFEKLGIEITKSEDELNIDWAKIYTPPQDEQFLEIQEIAKNKGGECLSTGYVNNNTKMKFRCKEGHEWEATPSSIKSRKSWCPDCAGNTKNTIKEMQEIAQQRKGKCLSTEYVNTKTNLKWKCECGHEWEARPSSIKSGSWCPRCSLNRSNKRPNEKMENMSAICGECNSILPNTNDRCANCGSNKKIINLCFSDDMNLRNRMHESFGLKAKDKTKTGRQKITLEVFQGHDKRKSHNDWVSKERVIDRANDKYLEHIETLEGEELHHEEGKLSDHKDRGYAKFKKISEDENRQ